MQDIRYRRTSSDFDLCESDPLGTKRVLYEPPQGAGTTSLESDCRCAAFKDFVTFPLQFAMPLRHSKFKGKLELNAVQTRSTNVVKKWVSAGLCDDERKMD